MAHFMRTWLGFAMSKVWIIPMLSLLGAHVGSSQTNPPTANTFQPATVRVRYSSTTKTFELSPVGSVHHFGKVKQGTILKHQFHIFNSCNGALQILSVRSTSGSLRARVVKSLLLTSEVSRLNIEVNCARFHGKKRMKVFVSVRCDQRQAEVELTVIANAQAQ